MVFMVAKENNLDIGRQAARHPILRQAYIYRANFRSHIGGVKLLCTSHCNIHGAFY
jgi:hypothetical protein